MACEGQIEAFVYSYITFFLFIAYLLLILLHVALLVILFLKCLDKLMFSLPPQSSHMEDLRITVEWLLKLITYYNALYTY